MQKSRESLDKQQEADFVGELIKENKELKRQIELFKNDKHILKLLTFEGFLQMFHDMMACYQTYKEAYEATERMHKNYFGKRKYSSYYSFKSYRSKMKK